MTRNISLHDIFSRLNRDFVGFDDLWKSVTDNAEILNPSGYPPYNIVKDGEDKFEITLAVAGFTPEEVSVALDGSSLTVTAEKKDEDTKTYLHKGIALRNFKREFRLAEFIEVVGADFSNGLLTITLEKRIPEEKKPKLIEVKVSK